MACSAMILKNLKIVPKSCMPDIKAIMNKISSFLTFPSLSLIAYIYETIFMTVLVPLLYSTLLYEETRHLLKKNFYDCLGSFALLHIFSMRKHDIFSIDMLCITILSIAISKYSILQLYYYFFLLQIQCFLKKILPNISLVSNYLVLSLLLLNSLAILITFGELIQVARF